MRTLCPERLDLHQMLFYFLHFRLEVVTKRLEHELAAAAHPRGFEKIFDALDDILRIVRKSEGKADAPGVQIVLLHDLLRPPATASRSSGSSS
jgi:DNA gyrase/topoisomerase IV subunit A